jgi:homogentisate phytyltransferase/homogentisate geranylgeranyltransferase
MTLAGPALRARTLWKFSRPHAFLGTLASILGLYGIALSRGGEPWAGLGILGWTLASCLTAAVFIVGLNQLFDVPIDRINKPYLPMASGELTRLQAGVLLALLEAVALTLAVLGGVYLLFTVAVSSAVGVVYSVPPWRWKRSPALAAACIIFVRGLVIPLGLYLHFADRLNGSHEIPVIVWVLAGFTVLFSAGIAWCKDIPDVEGDVSHDQRTYVLRFGPRAVFEVGRAVFLAALAAVLLAGALGVSGVQPAFLVASQVVLMAVVLARSWGVRPAEKASITAFYMFVWRVFQVEYLVVAAACLLSLY